MKKAILLMMMLAAGRLYAQAPVVTKAEIIHKTDTTIYPAKRYLVRPGDKVVKLITKMEDFNLQGDSVLTNQGMEIKFIRINGKHYDGMTVENVLTRLPAEVVDNIEMIDDYGDKTNIHTGMGPDKLLNINLKPGRIIDMRSFGFTGGGNPRTLYLPTDQRRITNMGTYRLRNSDEFNIADRNEASRRITRQIEQVQYDNEFRGREVNLYGDVMPHFLPGYDAWPGPGNKKKKIAAGADTIKVNRTN